MGFILDDMAMDIECDPCESTYIRSDFKPTPAIPQTPDESFLGIQKQEAGYFLRSGQVEPRLNNTNQRQDIRQ